MGEGPQEVELRKLIHDLHLEECVNFVGNMLHNEVLEFMSWCDVFALLSWDEPFNNLVEG